MQSYSEGALDEILREVVLQDRRSQVAFPNSTLTQFLLGVPTCVPPPCHCAGAELSCCVGQRPHRTCQHSAWAPFFSTTHITQGMDKDTAAALTPSARPAVPQEWCQADLVVPLELFGHKFRHIGSALAWIILPV